MSAVLRSKPWRFSIRLAVCLLVVTAQQTLWAAELPLLRVAHGALNEKVLALWIGVERGLFHKQGLDVEVVDVHSGPATIQALASDEVQVAYTVPSSVLSAALPRHRARPGSCRMAPYRRRDQSRLRWRRSHPHAPSQG